jgi:predicted regulator of Ras-like GTPase activity (Roadblock/LC7/MglB family)
VRAVASFEAALISNPHFGPAREKLAAIRGDDRRSPSERALAASQPEERQRTQPVRQLSDDQLREMAEAGGKCRSVEAAALADRSGMPAAFAALPSGVPASLLASAASLAASARDLGARLGAGRLQGVFIGGSRGGLRCVPLGENTLVLTLGPETPFETAVAEIDAAIADASAGARETEDP